MTPIALRLYAQLTGPTCTEALRQLNRIHGYPDGVLLDAEATLEHKAATRRLLAAHTVTVEIVSIGADGMPVFRMVST